MNGSMWKCKLLNIYSDGDEVCNEFNCRDTAAEIGVKRLVDACKVGSIYLALENWNSEFESSAGLKRVSGFDRGVSEIYLIPSFGAEETHDAGRTWVRSASKAMGPVLAKAVARYCESPATGGLCNGFLLMSKSADKVQIYNASKHLIGEGNEADVCLALKNYTGRNTLLLEVGSSAKGFICNGKQFFPRVVRTDFDDKLPWEAEFDEELCRDDIVEFILRRWPRIAALQNVWR